jgi:hypothetical protein
MYFILSSVYITVYFPNYLHNLLFSTYVFRPCLGHHQCFNEIEIDLKLATSTSNHTAYDSISEQPCK